MKGKIVLIPFPFTDLTAAKLRPALVLLEEKNDKRIRLRRRLRDASLILPSLQAGRLTEALSH